MSTHDFRTFCPKAFSGIGHLPDTVSDRSIPIGMQRKKSSEWVADFAEEAVEQDAGPFVAGAMQWATKERLQILRLTMTEVGRLEELSDRQRDVSKILLAIADDAGGGWPKRVREALVELFTGARDEAAVAEQLLQHLKTLFGNTAPEAVVSSAEICSRLCEDETWPWATWRNGLPFNKCTLANMLKPFEIYPGKVNSTPTGRQARGYKMAGFIDAWERYCPRTPGVRVSQASQTRASIDDS